MMSSAALPKVAFSSPPAAGPMRQASCSVAKPMSPASGTSDVAAVTNSHGEAGAVAAISQHTGAAARSRLRRLAASAVRSGRTSVAELVEILALGARQQIEERVEAAVERAP